MGINKRIFGEGNMIEFIIGIIVGAILGIILMAMMAIAGESDER